jgi:hypothetical protein
MKNIAHEKEVVHYDTGEVETLNDNFVQLYTDNLRLITEMNKENPAAVNLFMWLIEHMDRRNALVVSQQALAEAFNVSDRTIRAHVAFLKARKAIDVFKSGTSNIYAVNAQLAWKSDARGKKYAMFDARVYVAESEQNAQFETQLKGHAVPKKASPRQRQKQLDTIIGLGGSAALMATSIFSITQLF